MKIHDHSMARTFVQIGLLIVATACVHAAEQIVIHDAATNAQLSKAMRVQVDPMKNLKPATVAVDPSVANRPKSLLADSDILSFNGNATLVPKRAILQIPQNYTQRVRFQEGAALKSWKDFYSLNRGWITTVEVTRAQAEGTEPLPDTMRKIMTQSGNLVVATFMGGPISVLPQKAPAASNPTAS